MLFWRVMKGFLVLALASLSVAAFAQLPGLGRAPIQTGFGLKARVGYAFSGEFRRNDGKSTTIQGPELALIFPVLSLKKIDVTLEPSLFGGGRLRSGSGDDDGDVYRLIAVANVRGEKGTYLRLGAGYSQVNSRSQNFASASGLVGVFGLGFPVKGFLDKFRPNFEVNYFQANAGQLRALSIGIAGSF